MYNLDQIWHKIYLKKKPQKWIWSDLASNQIEIELNIDISITQYCIYA